MTLSILRQEGLTKLLLKSKLGNLAYFRSYRPSKWVQYPNFVDYNFKVKILQNRGPSRKILLNKIDFKLNFVQVLFRSNFPINPNFRHGKADASSSNFRKPVWIFERNLTIPMRFDRKKSMVKTVYLNSKWFWIKIRKTVLVSYRTDSKYPSYRVMTQLPHAHGYRIFKLKGLNWREGIVRDGSCDVSNIFWMFITYWCS